jgi:biopolymer transport protein ExbB
MVDVIFKLFNAMGSEWVMHIMIGLSVISFAVFLERFRNLRNQERVGALLWKERIESWMKSNQKEVTLVQIREWAKKYPCLEAGLVEVLVASQKKNKSDLSLLMESFLGRKRVELSKHLSFLGTVGSNAPFIGLFGTVLGIIKAFHDLSVASGGNNAGSQGVSLGLSEALVATAVGLMVAIPAVISFNFFQNKIKTIMTRAESLGQFVISSME